jgi:hypothetical protein
MTAAVLRVVGAICGAAAFYCAGLAVYALSRGEAIGCIVFLLLTVVLAAAFDASLRAACRPARRADGVTSKEP